MEENAREKGPQLYQLFRDWPMGHADSERKNWRSKNNLRPICLHIFARAAPGKGSATHSSFKADGWWRWSEAQGIEPPLLTAFAAGDNKAPQPIRKKKTLVRFGKILITS